MLRPLDRDTRARNLEMRKTVVGIAPPANAPVTASSSDAESAPPTAPERDGDADDADDDLPPGEPVTIARERDPETLPGSSERARRDVLPKRAGREVAGSSVGEAGARDDSVTAAAPRPRTSPVPTVQYDHEVRIRTVSQVDEGETLARGGDPVTVLAKLDPLDDAPALDDDDEFDGLATEAREVADEARLIDESVTLERPSVRLALAKGGRGHDAPEAPTKASPTGLSGEGRIARDDGSDDLAATRRGRRIKRRVPAPEDVESGESVTTSAPPALTEMLRDIARGVPSGLLHSLAEEDAAAPEPDPLSRTEVMPNAPRKLRPEQLAAAAGGSGGGPASAYPPVMVAPQAQPGAPSSVRLDAGSESGLRIGPTAPRTAERASLGAIGVPAPTTSDASVSSRSVEAIPLDARSSPTVIVRRPPRYGALVGAVVVVCIAIPLALFLFLSQNDAGSARDKARAASAPAADPVDRGDGTRPRAAKIGKPPSMPAVTPTPKRR